jgi:hypothetical protein
VTFTGAITTNSPNSALRAAIAFQDDIAKFAANIDTPITGTGGLRLVNGTARFLKPTTFASPMLVQNGYAVFLSTHTSSPIIAGTAAGVPTSSGPFVMGTGTVGAVAVNDGARLDPGPQLSTVGTLTIAGPLSFNNQGNYFATMGTSAADRVVVSGTVTTSGRLRPVVTAGFTATPNAAFVIIDNDGTDAVTGRFRGSVPNGTAEITLEEGALVVAENSTAVFRISYVGGTGNDVTLTHVSN